MATNFPVNLGSGTDRYALNAFQSIINAAWELGLDKAAEYEAALANGAAAFDVNNPPTMTTTNATVPTVEEPDVTIPTEVDTDAFDQFESQYTEIIIALADKYASFITTYFPADATNFAAVEAWLAAELADPDRVLPEALADVIWEEERARIQADVVRNSDEAITQWAAKGYPLPPGALTATTTAIALKGQEELAKSARNVAVKTFEMAYDKVKFVIGQAVEARKLGLQAAGQYLGAIASAPDAASKMVNVGYDAQSKLISAAASFFNARTQAAELTFKANSFNATNDHDTAKENLKAELTIIDDKLKTMLAQAESLSRLATSLFNNAHLQSGVSFSDSLSEQTQL